MMKAWNKNSTYLLIIIILGLGAIYYFSAQTILAPLQTELTTLESERVIYEAEVDKITEQIKSDDEEDTKLNDVLLQIPLTKAVDDVVLTIHRVAQASQLTVDSMSSLGTTRSGDAEDDKETQALTTRHRYSLHVTGDKLINLHRFLDELLVQDRLVTIDTLDIDQDDDDVSASLVFSVYYATH